MGANYKQSTLTTEPWQRCNRVVIDNQYNIIPIVHLQEELIIPIGDGEFASKDRGSIRETFADPTIQFPKLNPSTGEETGEFYTYQDMYVINHSFYIFRAKIRDAEIERQKIEAAQLEAERLAALAQTPAP